MVRIEKDYVFEGPNGKASLLDLFEGRLQLIIYSSDRATALGLVSWESQAWWSEGSCCTHPKPSRPTRHNGHARRRSMSRRGRPAGGCIPISTYCPQTSLRQGESALTIIFYQAAFDGTNLPRLSLPPSEPAAARGGA